jgi:hypothetical protein
VADVEDWPQTITSLESRFSQERRWSKGGAKRGQSRGQSTIPDRLTGSVTSEQKRIGEGRRGEQRMLNANARLSDSNSRNSANKGTPKGVSQQFLTGWQ